MKNGRYLLVGPLGSQDDEWITGARMAFTMFVRSLPTAGTRYWIVDSSRGAKTDRIGGISISRAWGAARTVIEAVVRIPASRHLYLVISSSWGGFLRDSLILWPAIIAGMEIKVHLHGGGYQAFYAGLSTRKKRLVKRTLNCVGCFIVLGEALRDQFSFLDSTPSIEIVPNGVPEIVDQGSFKPKKIGRGDGSIRLLYLSNMIPAKGYLDVLEACSILKTQFRTSIHCDFAGAFAQVSSQNGHGALRPAGEAAVLFQTKIEEYGLGHQVEYHGVVRAEHKTRLLLDCDVFVFPTYYEWEGQPLSIIEAMACGIPVVSTSHKSVPDLVEDGQTGLLVSARAPMEIAEAIKWFYQNPDKYTEFSRRAYERFRHRFTEQHYLRNLTRAVIGDSS